MTSDFRNVKRCMYLQLYQSFKIYLRCAQLLFIAPCNIEQERSSVTYFKQARFLVTSCALAWIATCGYQAIAKLIEVPMPFFTGILYVNEVVLCILISIQTMSIGYSETQRCNQFLHKILTVASAIPCTEWTEILAFVRLKLLWLCAMLLTIYGLSLCCDFLHYGSIYATLFSLGAYLLPNIFASMSLAQYYLGTILIYKMQQKINQLLSTGSGAINLQQAKHFYLQLDSCLKLLTRSFEILIVTNVFAGINVTSLQVLEIYQYLQAGASKSIYIAYNMLWILLQLCMLLMVLYPNEKFKREQTRFGTIMFELSHQNEAEMVEVQVRLKY
ncbi:putative gustatory receptor 59f [Anopheles funestus]|uniref:putative gustatory receptor 59f n=1 Tax=Anopheles funestus TaxID=62324 RepID=UPI0020C72AC6|nr:putative gustatory receptor 59f [Anopheles funestus]